MKDVIIFDLDGTLALIDHRKHLIENKPADWDAFYQACDKDLPNEPVMDLCQLLHELGYSCPHQAKRIIILSGRSDIVRDKTIAWLEYHKVYYYDLKMRKEGDFTPDEILKKQWAEEIDIEKIAMVFDDRDKVVKMWRDLGITCLQVAEGKF